MSDFSRFVADCLLQWRYVRGQDLSQPQGRSNLMASDHIARAPVSSGIIFYFPGGRVWAWGLGLPCAPIPATPSRPPPGSLGELKWGPGASGCYMVIDRKQEMFFVPA